MKTVQQVGTNRMTKDAILDAMALLHPSQDEIHTSKMEGCQLAPSAVAHASNVCQIQGSVQLRALCLVLLSRPVKYLVQIGQLQCP